MMNNINDARFLRALNKQPVDRTPVWIMRQAGRYLPEYKALRAQAGDFLSLCKNPALACQVTMQPIKRYALDAAILFSDILLIPDAMGLGLSFVADEGPKFARPVQSAADIEQLPTIDPEQDLAYVSATIKLLVRELEAQTPLIGFAGSPWTVATYMVEGQSSKHFNKIKGLMYAQPKVMHKLLAHMTTQTINALQAQINAGVQAVMVFDTWGGILTDHMYQEFSLRYMAEIVQTLKANNPQIPTIIFSKNGGRCLSQQAATGCNAIGLDWTADLAAAKILVGDKVALQGNMDPAVLYATPDTIIKEVQNVLAQFGSGYGHIFNLGHGIGADVNPEHVQIMLDAVKTYSPKYLPASVTV